MLCGNDWILKKHTIAASFPRERPRSILNPDVQLKLAINQYIPVDQSPTPGDITLIFCPGNGLHKVHIYTFSCFVMRRGLRRGLRRGGAYILT